jgi:hypothetical protein
MHLITLRSRKYDGSSRNKYDAFLYAEDAESYLVYVPPGTSCYDHRKQMRSLAPDGVLERYCKNRWYTIWYICAHHQRVTALYIHTTHDVASHLRAQRRVSRERTDRLNLRGEGVGGSRLRLGVAPGTAPLRLPIGLAPKNARPWSGKCWSQSLPFSFVGAFARRPDIDWTSNGAGRGASQIDDCHNLFRGESARPPCGAHQPRRRCGPASLRRCGARTGWWIAARLAAGRQP